jgi:small subunit ribosomal protein S9
MIKNFIEAFEKSPIGIGRRKESTARVFLKPGKGNLIINNISGEKYLQNNKSYLNNILLPLRLLKLTNKYNIFVLTNGGGLVGQISSIKLGVARLLSTLKLENRSILKKENLLTRDSRIKERKKYGLRKARKAPQYSKR